MVLTAYFALSPVTGLFCHRRFADIGASQPGRAEHASTKLDASVGASGPHDFTVRDIVVRLHVCESLTIPKDRALQPRPRADAVTSTVSRPAFRDDRERPSVGRDGALIGVILARQEAECFLAEVWTRGFDN
jgi:hypothetical protein